MARPITNMARFVEAHLELGGKLNEYILTGRGREKLNDEARENLRDRSAKSLKATNPRARIAFVEALDRELSQYFDQGESPDKLFWVTITPRAWACPHIIADQFDNRNARRDLISLLQGLSYVGMIDAAFYGNKTASAWDRSTNGYVHSQIMSFHAHLLVWGRDVTYMEGLRDAHNLFVPSLFPGHDSFFFRAITPSKAREKAFYMAKAPLKEMRIQKKTAPVEIANSETGEFFEMPRPRVRSRKGGLRQGDACKIHNALSRFSIPDFALAHGAGRRIMRLSIESAQQRLQREDDEQRQEISRLLRL
ncbi:MAG: hypothetical protein KL863_27655 [Rhizobium sp.]|nr:hypothetical protein [Rhizobium sp.]